MFFSIASRRWSMSKEPQEALTAPTRYLNDSKAMLAFQAFQELLQVTKPGEAKASRGLCIHRAPGREILESKTNEDKRISQNRILLP